MTTPGPPVSLPTPPTPPGKPVRENGELINPVYSETEWARPGNPNHVKNPGEES